ncbi:HpcH/HpaI aldolase family protein [Solimonas marina]|uniref:Aldolase n=1 Tax=Solimonas marina TaxID=2714601 RepID=A0A969WDC0_9GAMM|nr:aldolase/citrate lyase family protein [Solimonas marina]NKF24124.1 aldolase [Solimonas marina]
MASLVAEGPVSVMLERKVRSGVPVIGTFVKTLSGQTVEVLGQSGMDFVVLDAEHAPFGIESVDRALCASRAASLDTLVRVPNHDPAFINSCLDSGACGIVAPHIRSADAAQSIVDAVRYDRGKRGFSPSGRAGRYGAFDASAYRQAADATNMVWCQIEDHDAMDRLDEIAAVDGVDCLFIGPADLSLSLGLDGQDDPRLQDAIKKIAAAGRHHHKAVALFVPSVERVGPMLDLDITVFVCGSDQSLMLGRARSVAAEMAALSKGRS